MGFHSDGLASCVLSQLQASLLQEGLPFSLTWSLVQINLEPILLSLTLPVLASGSVSLLCWLIDMILEIEGSLVMGEDLSMHTDRIKAGKETERKPRDMKESLVGGLSFSFKDFNH